MTRCLYNSTISEFFESSPQALLGLFVQNYHGITQTEKKGKRLFVARLHLNGDVIIGKYTTEIKAAIAYNKAVDYARDHGIQKNFIQNYIADLSAREYADVYSALKLSQTYLDYIDSFVI